MRNFIFGLLLGTSLTGSLGFAGTFYDSKGQPHAPRGTVQQFDYFRERQLFLDTGAIRRQMERDRLEQATTPCAR